MLTKDLVYSVRCTCTPVGCQDYASCGKDNFCFNDKNNVSNFYFLQDYNLLGKNTFFQINKLTTCWYHIVYYHGCKKLWSGFVQCEGHLMPNPSAKGCLFIFNHSIDMRTDFNLSISCWKNMFLLDVFCILLIKTNSFDFFLTCTTIMYTVLHNSNLEIRWFWPKALQIHCFLKKIHFSTYV